jgi:hypothetical protein
MPTFKTPPDPDASVRSPYDDLNRMDRAQDRAHDRNSDRPPRQLDEADLRAYERVERVLERNGRDLDTGKEADAVAVVAAVKGGQPRKNGDGTDPLIQGLFSKLPEPESEWPLAARQKWLQTAANIFDLMYAPHQADAGELSIRVERNSAR